MAKKSLIRRNKKRQIIHSKSNEKRSLLIKITKNKNLSFRERLDAHLKLSELSKDSFGVRIRNRCSFTGRPRGNLRKFGISRIALRNLALWGQIPGLIKSSW